MNIRPKSTRLPAVTSLALILALALALACVLLPMSSQAALVLTPNQASQTTDGYEALNSFTASSVDLAQNGSATLTSSTFSGSTTFGSPVELGNGVLDNTSGNGAYLAATFSGGHLPNTLTITLDTSINTLGYDITGITTYAGHNENGSALANQQYLLEYSLAGSATFTSLGVQTYTPFNNADTNVAAGTELALTDDTGTIASGVDAIRLTFQDHGFFNGLAIVDGTVYREVDVFGTFTISSPPVPEPSRVVLLGLGLVVLCGVRRRPARRR